ncbi:hypothetical protein AB5I41_07380 [Sphingomonas sp. MMS24-JH45]
MWGGKGAGSVVRGGVAIAENVMKVDDDFLRVFDLPMVRGDKATALRDFDQCDHRESMAHEYFSAGGMRSARR